MVTVRAIDADIGPNGAVRFRLRDAHHFSIHASSGALRTAHTLDRDKQTTYRVSGNTTTEKIGTSKPLTFARSHLIKIRQA